jgi:DNA-binding response OmpR family regulator
MTKCLLLVEGQPGLLLNLTDRLAGEGWEVAAAEAAGLEMVREFKRQGLDVPVLMLKSRESEDESPAPRTGAGDVHRFGGLKVDLAKNRVERDGVTLAITGKQFQLLRYFVEHPGKTVSREELLDVVWGQRKRRSTRTVDVHVAWLRKKLESDPRFPRYITTIYGMGYRFAPPASRGARSLSAVPR